MQQNKVAQFMGGKSGLSTKVVLHLYILHAISKLSTHFLGDMIFKADCLRNSKMASKF